MTSNMTIQSHWEDFRQKVIPEDACEAQVKDMQIAFYGGVMSLLVIQWEVGSKGISEDAGVAILQGVHDEVRLFKDELLKGTN